jgi:two-component system, NarL family, nitrate/nitrite response regulator NarL
VRELSGVRTRRGMSTSSRRSHCLTQLTLTYREMPDTFLSARDKQQTKPWRRICCHALLGGLVSIPATWPIGVLLVDHHRCLLWGLAKLIESARPQLELAGLATCHSEALAAMEKHRPHVVVLDLDLGSESGFDLLPHLASQAAVLILTGLRDADALERAVLAGARGFIHKSEPAEVILKAIERVHLGEVWLNRSTMGRVLQTLSRRRGSASEQWAYSALTAAERKVVAAVVRQKTAPNKVIAATLNISEHTLPNRLSAIYGKLGISKRLDLVLHAMEHRFEQPLAGVH